MNAPGRCAALLATVLAAGGCINLGLRDIGGTPDLHRHTLDAAAGVPSKKGAAPGLSVRSFGARARYDLRVVQRGGADHFVYLEFERWGEQPANAVTDAVREALAGTGSFTAVSAAGDALVADRYLDGYVLAFDLVETPSGPWKARVALRLVLSDRAGKLLHTSVYDASRPLPGRDPAGLGPAMAASVGEAVTKALADWEAAGLMR